jgi:UDP-glucose 4-epimerase
MGKGCVMVSGGAGYIGSHVVLDLIDGGWDVVVLDNLSTGMRDAVPEAAEFVHGNAGDGELVTRLLRDRHCRAVLHFAGSTVVPDSVKDPLGYYLNNTMVSRSLLAACVNADVERFIFSSTAAVYGNPDRLPVDEDCPPRPTTPYGMSKLMTERMLDDVAAATGLGYVALRYFNVAGADPGRRTGQSTPQASHLIKVACQVAVGLRPSMPIFGDDYATPDGTCVRDFIHVSDLAAAHVTALEHLERGGDNRVLNAGYGWGISVRQVVAATERLADRPIPCVVMPRREGDIVTMVADASRIRHAFDWVPRHDSIEAIIGSALAWEQGLHTRRDGTRA